MPTSSLDTLANIVARHDDQPQFLLSLIERWPGLAMLGTAEGNVIAASSLWGEYTGITANELRRHGWRRFIHPEDANKTEHEVLRMRADGQATLGFKNRYVAASGQVNHFSWVATPYRGNNDLTLAVADLRRVDPPKASS